MISGVVRQLESSGEVEITSDQIGESVMEGLKSLDDVAFVRFASVYKNFSAASDFSKFLKLLDEDSESDLSDNENE
jgi:transcriptional repressor NrdR